MMSFLRMVGGVLGVLVSGAAVAASPVCFEAPKSASVREQGLPERVCFEKLALKPADRVSGQPAQLQIGGGTYSGSFVTELEQLDPISTRAATTLTSALSGPGGCGTAWESALILETFWQEGVSVPAGLSLKAEVLETSDDCHMAYSKRVVRYQLSR